MMVCFLSAVEPSPSNLGTSGKSCPPPSASCGGISRLMVTPRVSGLERSQEKSLESHLPEPVPSSTSSGPNFSCLSSHSPVTASVAVPRPSPVNGNSTHHNGTPSLPGPPPSFLELRRSGSASCKFIIITGLGCPVVFNVWFSSCFISSGRLKLPTASSVASSSSSMCPPTPSTSVSMRCSRGLGSSGPLRPPSRASSGNLYTSSPGLPPPPPLLPPAHPAAAGKVKKSATNHHNYS